MMRKRRFRIAALLFALLLLFCSCQQEENKDTGTAESQSIVHTPPSKTPQQDADGTASNIKNVVLIIGDGMGLEHIGAAQMCEGKRLCFTDWQYASVNTDSVNEDGQGSVLTDSAAAATAMATGSLTVNGYVGKNSRGRDLSTVLDEARRLGKATGIVTTDTLYGATPAAFSAHSFARTDAAGIVMSQLSSGVELLCGTTDVLCSDRKNAITAAGYRYCDSLSAASASMEADRAYWQLPLAGSNASVALCDATTVALEYLSRDEDGFCLVVEQAHIDKYAHSNLFAETVACVKSLDDTVAAVLAWIGDRDDTAVIVTADHETGGLSVSYQNRLANAYEGVSATVYYEFSSVEHTDQEVGIFLWGIEVDLSEYSYSSRHLIKNTDVYYIVCDILNHTLW